LLLLVMQTNELWLAFITTAATQAKCFSSS
jgi:hypothetical protein